MSTLKYSPEFKREAVKLLKSGDKPVTEIAKQLGVKRTLLYLWRDQEKEKGELAFPGRGGRPKKENSSEVQQLRAENERLKEELEILKKAAAYFARELK